MVSPSSLPFAFATMKPSVDIAPECKSLLKLAAKKLKSHDRRLFVAEVAETLCYSSPRLTETEFGFGRHTVELGMHEKRTGMICYGNYASSGKRKSEDVSPQLAEDIRCLVEPESQADPQLRNTFAYTRVTAKSVRQKLIEEKNWDNHSLPQVRTVNNILNRLGYKLRKVEKTKPEKKSRKPMSSLPISVESGKMPTKEKTSCNSA